MPPPTMPSKLAPIPCSTKVNNIPTFAPIVYLSHAKMCTKKDCTIIDFFALDAVADPEEVEARHKQSHQSGAHLDGPTVGAYAIGEVGRHIHNPMDYGGGKPGEGGR
jgi:hypothetical protein